MLTQSSINLPVVPGQNYRASVWASITAGMTLNVDMSFHDSAGTLLLAAGRGAMSTAAGGTVIVQPGVWTQFGSAAAKAPSNAVFARVRIFADSGPDGTAYATKAQLTPGLTIPDFADGRTPGWRFEGAADNSTSVGYPPR
ncbi:hypothetical protein [Glaciihabitans sp. dw_435]|uniref:hypothetical protein n=1 Tax=Glaciihabitans sp. dw_435 TaxID=2720081 RepID=UPI001BD30B67|nr:hypothetical protein [Glaciihabitans sp. dw_435]